MGNTNRRIRRDPYFHWKIVNMVLSVAILVLSVLILLGTLGGVMIPVTILMCALMSAFCGIMELAKGRRFIGYACSVFAGLMAVTLILSVIQLLGIL